MKKLFALILLLSVLPSWGAIKYYDDYPNNANPPTNFIISIQTKDKSAGGIPYNYWELFQMSDWLAANGLAGQGSNVTFNIVTNNIEYVTNLTVTTNFVDVSYITNLYAGNTFITNFYTTNFNATYITNNTFYSSNVFATNITVDVITNNTFYSTNVVVHNITNQNFYTTNITVEQPGGFTNLNLTPLTVMFADANSSESSIPNAPGVLTNNGSGGVGFSQSLSLQELDAQNFYPTNMFTGLTNYQVLGTDANGMLVLGASTITNITITNAFIQNLTNNNFYNTNSYISTNFSTNLYFVSGKGNTLIITNNLMLDYLSASKLLSTDGAKNVTNADVNATLSFSGNVLGVAAGGTPSINLINSTNLYATNMIMTPTLWGGPSNAIVINNGYQQYATSTPTSITNQTTTSVWSTLVISNQLSTSITQFCTIPNIRYIGANSTNALTVGAGKVGVWSFLTFAGQLTNCVNLSQQ